jgi:predicted Zn-dependent protease
MHFFKGEMTRRTFLQLTALGSAWFVAGCAVNPVTGESQLMLVSESDEIAGDRANSPHQFSADYGTIQDRALNDYIHRTGMAIAARTHRPNMPYSFRGVNAVYANAYAFPGGSIACTRGILLELENEAELAGLLGHELGHVNARHTAQQMSKGMLTSAVVGGFATVLSAGSQGLGQLAAGLGGIGAGALLAKYSRDNERQADALGMEYMVKSGYSPVGMVGLMDILRQMSKRKPSAIELMFATHPMSDERYRTVVRETGTKYVKVKDYPLYRERYMDHTVRLRGKRKAIEAMQAGEKEMARKRYAAAENHFRRALNQAPEDYAGLALMCKCQFMQKRYREAEQYAHRAKQVYPGEAQAYHLSGVCDLLKKQYGSAYEEFNQYERRLPGNPNIIFLKGLSLEGAGRQRAAANEYYRYLKQVNRGDQAQYAYKRLVDWGYVKP